MGRVIGELAHGLGELELIREELRGRDLTDTGDRLRGARHELGR
jgi:hypothetical protein